MYSLYRSIKDRMERYLRASTLLTQNAAAGSQILHVEDAKYFGFEGLNKYCPHIILMDSRTTGERTEDGGYSGAELIKVENVDISGNTIYLQTPLKNDWLLSRTAEIARAPGEVIVNDVVIGDLQVVQKFPTVCVNPTSKSMQWYTMPGSTNEKCNIEFLVYVAGGGTEQATTDLLKLTDAVEWILMSNLHIQVSEEISQYAVTSAALVDNISYGVIQKGSEFLKASKLSWTGNVTMLRDYLLGNRTSLYPGEIEGQP